MYVKEGGFISGLDQFAAKQFGITPAEAKQLDPQQRLLLEVGYDALHRAGYDRASLLENRVGVFVGAAPSGFQNVLKEGGATTSTYSATGASAAVISKPPWKILD